MTWFLLHCYVGGGVLSWCRPGADDPAMTRAQCEVLRNSGAPQRHFEYICFGPDGKFYRKKMKNRQRKWGEGAK